MAKDDKLILVAEDEPQIAELLKMVLDMKGYEVKMTSSRREAVAALQELKAAGREPGLLITDYGLIDGKTGIDLLHDVKAVSPETGRMMLSGSVTQKDLDQAGLPEVQALGKPFTMSELFSAMDRAKTQGKPSVAADAQVSMGAVLPPSRSLPPAAREALGEGSGPSIAG